MMLLFAVVTVVAAAMLVVMFFALMMMMFHLSSLSRWGTQTQVEFQYEVQMGSLWLNCDRCCKSSQTITIVLSQFPRYGVQTSSFANAKFLPASCPHQPPGSSHLHSTSHLESASGECSLSLIIIEHNWWSTLSKRGCMSFIPSTIWVLWEWTPFVVTPGVIRGGIMIAA